MKILVVSHTYIVDLNRQKLRLLANLSSEIEVTIVVPRRWKPGGVQHQIIESKFLKEGSFRVIPISNFSQNHQGLLTFGWDIIPLLRQFHPQIIQVEQASRSLAYTQLILLNRWLNLNAKNLFFTWWNLPYSLKWPVSQLEAFNLRHTHGLIAGNQDAAEILYRQGYEGPVKVLPQLGVDDKLFYPQPQPELRQKLGIGSHEFVIGFVGRFVEEKGLLTLGKALIKLLEYPWKLLLVGRGSFQPILEQWAIENQIQNRLIWVEGVPHEQVPNYINTLNVLVLPSETTGKFKTLTTSGWKEQFGHVLIEAMACKIPVIGSNSGEIPNVIGEAGLIFPEGDVEALRNCLIQLLMDADFAQELGQKGYKRIQTYYTNQALAKAQLNFYQELLTHEN